VAVSGLPGVLVREEPSRITAGCGSIVWDAALALASLFAAFERTRPPPRALRRAPAPAVPLRDGAAAAALTAALAALRWPGLRVVDLGTGTGVVGLAAAVRGARVALTDLPDVLSLARANAAAAAPAVKLAGGEITVAPLVWGERGAGVCACVQSADGGGAAPRPPLLARCCGGLQPPFDVVIASEVAFRGELFPDIVHTLRALRCGLAIVAARERACCDIADFFQLLSESFDIAELVPAAESSAAAPTLPAAAVAAGGDVLEPLARAGVLCRLPLLPPDVAAIIDASRVSSKLAACPPRLFALLQRAPRV
jgi:hypothetical protein